MRPRRRPMSGPAPVARPVNLPRVRRLSVVPGSMQMHRQALAQQPALAQCPMVEATSLDELAARMLADDAICAHQGRLVRTVESDDASPTGRRFRCYRA